MVDQLFAVVHQRAAAYRALAEAYDGELLSAHNAGHGTLEALQHLRRANALAPGVMSALSDYQSAVTQLARQLSARLATRDPAAKVFSRLASDR
jgi:hypothetical protein